MLDVNSSSVKFQQDEVDHRTVKKSEHRIHDLKIKLSETNSMTMRYYKLSLKTRQKPPKTVIFQRDGSDLEHLNLIMNSILKDVRILKSRNGILTNILKILDKIIPNEYFGTCYHRKLFYLTVKRIYTQSTFECIHKSALTRGYDLKLVPWLVAVRNENTGKHLLLEANLFVLERVVKPLIAFYMKPVKTYVSYEIIFVPRGEWNSFETKVFRYLLKSGYLVEKEERLTHEPRGNLNIVPKGNGEFRPIVSLFRGVKKLIYKQVTKQVYDAARALSSVSSFLYNRWKAFAEKYRDENVYGIKLDVKDAYGNVDIEVLSTAIRRLRGTYLDEEEVNFVINHITNQFVTFRRKVYRWKHGLLQGDRLSSCLCELYMAYVDGPFKFPDNCFVYRTVDDYFFCSTDPHSVTYFKELIKSHHQINEAKTKANVLDKSDSQIPYCGKLFDLRTKEVKKLYSFGDKYEIRYKFKFWNHNRQVSENNGRDFLKRILDFSYNNNSFTGMELNTVFNSEKTVLENFFDGMVYLCYKFDAAVMAMRGSFVDDFEFVLEVLESVVETYCRKVFKMIKKHRGRQYRRGIDYNVLKTVAHTAFIQVLKRRSKIYEQVIDVLDSATPKFPPMNEIPTLQCSEWTYTMRRNMQEIIPGLFLGPYSSAQKNCLKTLRDQGITHIICVRQDVEAQYIKPQINDLSITYLTLNIADTATENIIRFFPTVKQFIDEAFQKNGKVLVHGNNGISRSATLVLAYIMEKYGLSSKEAIECVKRRRGCIHPNEGFLAQLVEYEPIYKARQTLERGETSNENRRQKRKSEQLCESGDYDLIQPPPSPISDNNNYCQPTTDFSNHLYKLWMMEKS